MPLEPKLTLREHRAVWMLSTGSSLGEIGLALGIVEHSVSQVLTRARVKFHHTNRYAFVAWACLNGLIGPEIDCGKSSTAWRRHQDKDEPACPACRRFHTGRLTAEASERPELEISLTQREMDVLTALAAGADSMQSISEHTGLSKKRAANHLSSIYDKLNIPHRDNRDRRHIALYVARQRGVFPLPNGTYLTRRGAVFVPPQMRLSPKQVDLLKVVDTGCSLTVAGERLGLPREAVSARLSEIYRRLGISRDGVRNNDIRRARRKEAISKAREYGLMD